MLALAAALWIPTSAPAPPKVKTSSGIVQGTAEPSGVHVFRGIPYAAPPVGSFRWQPPQPAKPWTGVRPADRFGPRCMQRGLFSDMVFRSNGMSEDCLYLNVWTPQVSGNGRLPVLVYFYGGGFLAGDGSEPRYDGEAMARKGIVALTVNYRLNVFGFLARDNRWRIGRIDLGQRADGVAAVEGPDRGRDWRERRDDQTHASADPTRGR